MSAFDPLPHLRSATDASEARSAELLASLSGISPPAWPGTLEAITEVLGELETLAVEEIEEA